MINPDGYKSHSKLFVVHQCNLKIKGEHARSTYRITVSVFAHTPLTMIFDKIAPTFSNVLCASYARRVTADALLQFFTEPGFAGQYFVNLGNPALA